MNITLPLPLLLDVGVRAVAVRPPITALILTKNSERLLANVLASVAWCDEILVFDTGSTDRTLSIARSNPDVCTHQLAAGFPGFGWARRHAVGLARNDWILSVDSDEIISSELADEISRLSLDSACVYSAPFDNYFNGKRITTCGWAPDRHERLFNRRATNFCASKVHERVQIRGLTVVPLRHSIRHLSYQSPDDFLVKMTAYARLFAEQNAGVRRASTPKAVLRSLWAFFKSYILERGLLQGPEGLLISAYKAQTVFWKYILLRHANRQHAA